MVGAAAFRVVWDKREVLGSSLGLSKKRERKEKKVQDIDGVGLFEVAFVHMRRNK